MEFPVVAGFIGDGLREGNIWVGNSDGMPEESTALKDFFSRYLLLRQEVLNIERQGTFIVQKAHYLLEYAQALNKLAPGGILKSDSEGIISIAIPGEDYLTEDDIKDIVDATYILQKPNNKLSNAQALIYLAPGGILKSDNYGVVSIAVADEDYASQDEVEKLQDSVKNIEDEVSRIENAKVIVQQPSDSFPSAQALDALAPGGILKSNFSGVISIAIGGEDYVTPEQLQQLQNELDRLELEVDILKTRITTMQGQIATIQGEIATIQGEIASLASVISIIQGEISTIQGEMLALAVSIGIIQAQIIAINYNINQIRDDINDIKDNIDDIEENISDLRNDLNNLNYNFNILKNEFNNFKNMLDYDFSAIGGLINLKPFVDFLVYIFGSGTTEDPYKADVILDGDVSGQGRINESIQTNFNLNLNKISDKNITTGNINMAGYNIKNVNCQPEDSQDAVNVCFLWKLLNGEVDILWQ